MKKIFFSLIASLCLLGVLILPESGFAFMTTLSEAGMRSATAQAGIAFSAVDSVALRMEIDTIAYGDAGSEDESGAYLSLNNTFLQGSITTNESANGSVRVEVSTEPNLFTGLVETGVNIAVRDVEINVDRFEIGSITVGTNPGEGPSFGRFVVEGFHAKISGDIRITTH
jgi:hypothetical protein